VVRLDDLGHLARFVGAGRVAEDEPADAVAAEVVGDDVPLPVVRQVPAAEDFEAAVFRAAISSIAAMTSGSARGAVTFSGRPSCTSDGIERKRSLASESPTNASISWRSSGEFGI
jgi:hypothetical protein